MWKLSSTPDWFGWSWIQHVMFPKDHLQFEDLISKNVTLHLTDPVVFLLNVGKVSCWLITEMSDRTTTDGRESVSYCRYLNFVWNWNNAKNKQTIHTDVPTLYICMYIYMYIKIYTYTLLPLTVGTLLVFWFWNYRWIVTILEVTDH